jgi:hypothetical protein
MSRNDELNERPSELEQTVGMLAKTASMQEAGAAVPMSVRLPLYVHCQIKAMAEHSGHSINRIAIQVLRVGIDAITEALPEGDAIAIQKRANRLAHEAHEATAKFEQLGEDD